MQLIISSSYAEMPETKALMQAASDRDIAVDVIINSYGAHRSLAKNANVAFYGSVAFCEFLAQETKYQLHSNSLDWVTKLPSHISKRKINYMTLEDARAQKAEIIGKKIVEHADPDDVSFLKGVPTNNLPLEASETPVLVSPDIDWMCKYRFLVVDGKIANWCCFKLEKVFNLPSIHCARFSDSNFMDHEKFMNMTLSQTNTAPACCIDVGYSKSLPSGLAGWAILGSQPVWSAQMYGCNPVQFLRALFVACEPLDSK